MSTLKSLYRQIILDHYKRPRNKGIPDDVSYIRMHLSNPSCGDTLTLSVKLNNNVIEDVKHDGDGCSICCASSSVMSELVTGKTTEAAEDLSLEFSKMLLGQEINQETLGEAIAFEGVKDFPARMKCATLSWKALEKALKEEPHARQ